jgi:hypothetical protein
MCVKLINLNVFIRELDSFDEKVGKPSMKPYSTLSLTGRQEFRLVTDLDWHP